MRIIMMNGGLGNQLYQFAFLRCIEEISNEQCLVDDSEFWALDKVEHNGYELERVFGIRLNLLSEYFSEDVWMEMINNRKKGISIPQQLLDNGIDIMAFVESRGDFIFKGNMVPINPTRLSHATVLEMGEAQGNIYYHGYWVDFTYFSLVSNKIRRELKFPELDYMMEKNTINKHYSDLAILLESIAVHIRRGDFVKLGRAVSPEKYRNVVKNLLAKYPNATFFVFSDEPSWCKDNENLLGLDEISENNIIYVEENIGEGKNYIDMQLMSQCKHLIISNSSFGQWAYLLNINPNVDAVFV